jgi:hypothetical protein
VEVSYYLFFYKVIYNKSKLQFGDILNNKEMLIKHQNAVEYNLDAVFTAMSQKSNNPNYKTFKNLFPKSYNKTLFDNCNN